MPGSGRRLECVHPPPYHVYLGQRSGKTGTDDLSTGGAKTQTEERSHWAQVKCEWTLALIHDAKVTQQYLIRDFLLKETSGGTPTFSST